MTSEWPLKKISDVAEFLNHKRVPLKSLDRDKRQGEFPYYGASGVVDYIDDYIFDGTYLLISEDGENLRTRNTPIAFKAIGKFWVNNHAHILSEKEEGILDYLEYYFSKLDLSPYITGAVQPKLNKTNLDCIEIPIPPKNERLSINKVLNSLTNKIELNRQTNQTLEHIAQAIFKSWFVDFEPTRAKIAARQAYHNLTPAEKAGLSEQHYIERAAICAISGKTPEQLDQLNPETQQQLKTTAALFPDALVESELGEVPEGWSVSEIGNEVTVIGGGTPSTKNPEFWDGGEIYWTTPKDMSNLTDKILIDTIRKITEAGLEKISSGLLPVNTVLMSSRAPVGYLAISKIPVAVNQGYIAMKCEGQLSPEYIVQWSESVMDDIKQRASGTTFAEISKKNFKMIPVLVPDVNIIRNYSDIVSKLYEKITESLMETASLSKLRDSLLPKLLSGEINITNIQNKEVA